MSRVREFSALYYISLGVGLVCVVVQNYPAAIGFAFACMIALGGRESAVRADAHQQMFESLRAEANEKLEKSVQALLRAAATAGRAMHNQN